MVRTGSEQACAEFSHYAFVGHCSNYSNGTPGQQAESTLLYYSRK
jgi:hypothetical protein